MKTPNERHTRPEPDDTLDALLASDAVRPGPDFVDRTLARIERDSAQRDGDLDALLESTPVRPCADFADRVLASVRAARRRRTFVRVFAPWAAAACVALVALPTLVVSGRARTPGDPVAALLHADSELRALAALPAAKTSGEALKTEDLATLAGIGALFAEDSNDYSL